VFAGLGVGQPEQQVDIHEEHGRFVARVDFLFRKQRVVVEFDGLTKYAGADGREALVAEKTPRGRAAAARLPGTARNSARSAGFPAVGPTGVTGVTKR
jgi:hypothetical protein